MSSDTGVTLLLERAKDQEKKFSWLEATKSYEEAVNSGSMSQPILAETWERIGFCYDLASRQAETIEEFRKLRHLAAEAYENTASILENEHDQKKRGKIEQCDALAEHVRSWLASDSSEKRRMLDECLRIGKSSIEAYKSAGDELNYGKMCNELLFCLFERLYLASDWKEMRDFAQQGIDYADKAIAVLSKLESKAELLEAYYTASLQSWYAANVSEEEEKGRELIKRSLVCSDEALKLSKEIDNPYQIAMANWATAFCTLLFTEKVDVALEHAQEMLKQATAVKDNYLKGIALYALTFVTNWMIVREADPDKKKEECRKIVEYAGDGIRLLELVAQDFFIAQIYFLYAESYSFLALEVGSNAEERREDMEKAITIGREGLDHANRSGSADAMISTLHALSKALQFCSKIVTRNDAKVKLLNEALVHRQEHTKVAEKVFPSSDWVRGVGENYEGLIKLDLARLETNDDKRKTLLESAVSDMEDGVSRCKRAILSRPVPTLQAAVGNYENGFGSILCELYLQTQDDNVLNRATEVYEDSANEFKKANLPSRVAECYWRVARNQDYLGKYDKAAERFENAFDEYKTATQRIPHFANFYSKYATYMKAWSEIERAKFAHDREEYVTAKEHYKKTTDLLQSSKLWSYLSSNFLAWSLLEQAEDSSRKESSTESIEAFTKAAQFFEEAKRSFEKEIEKIQDVDEKEKAIELGRASVPRKDYCLARINVERARMYDRKGDYAASAQEYDSAAGMFERMVEYAETETDRKEIKPIAAMCRAWQKMKMADGRASPELYGEASELFLKIREHSMKDKTLLLASGNSAFCQALEYGTRFEVTREKEEFSRAKRFLESAANYYLKAGFDGASSWTNATGILFDAYNYMISAELEVDPEKKMKSLILAEKCLERSAGLYDAAGYVGKKEEVLRILAKVREKREFAMSLGEFLATPIDASTTRMIPTPSMTVEEPVGLQKFDNAFVQANLIAGKKVASAGESIDLDVHFANLGKSVAFLVRVEGILPYGLDLMEEPETCRLEDSGLNMKGRRLEPLRTEELRFELSAFDKGTFEIKPKIIYADETGHQMSCEPEPVIVNVSKVILPDRVPTGYGDLDNLLLGGIPEKYSVLLTSPSCDERSLLIRRFLEVGATKGELTFCVTVDAGSVTALAEDQQSNFYLFVCNPRADEIVKSLPNVFKLKGVENLTEISIALTSALRRLDASIAGPKRACIEIISDALLQHHAVATRRWLTSIIPELRSRGFTTLAVMNPQMHNLEEVQAILDVFEGEINIYEKETRKGSQKLIRIRKMYNQKYLESKLPLKKERLISWKKSGANGPN
jgi:KaiC/GvpD/RAD55 family RecA-like ATPase/tetratricopeptide (TPR) repeat protein